MSDPIQTTRLLDLVCARLCHDLGGLIGTVGNAMEMVVEDSGDNEVVAFAATATRALTQRLRLLRAAWTGETEPWSLTALRALLLPALEARRIVLDTGALPEACCFSPGFGRVALNVLLLAHDSLPRGGTITVSGAARDLVVRINGVGAAWPRGLMGLPRDVEAALVAVEDARGAQTPLTVLLALSRGVRLSPVFGAGAPALRLEEG